MYKGNSPFNVFIELQQVENIVLANSALLVQQSQHTNSTVRVYDVQEFRIGLNVYDTLTNAEPDWKIL